MGWTKLWQPVQQLRTDLLNALGESAFATAYTEGQQMILEDAIALWKRENP